MLKGSARSIDQVSMFEILNAHQDLITKFGGHHMAAGMTMDIENIDELRKGLNEWMKQLSESTSLAPRKHVDVLLNESEITVKNIQDIQKLRPFGTDFNSPTFEVNDLNVKSIKAIGQEGKHLKVALGENQLAALYWSYGHLAKEIEMGQPLNLIGNLQINEWNGNQSPQLIIQDIATETIQILDYRSKRKHLQFTENNSNTAYVIHPKRIKPMSIIIIMVKL